MVGSAVLHGNVKITWKGVVGYLVILMLRCNHLILARGGGCQKNVVSDPEKITTPLCVCETIQHPLRVTKIHPPSNS